MNNTNTLHFLALDGGGTRGIYSAQLIAQVEDTFTENPRSMPTTLHCYFSYFT